MEQHAMELHRNSLQQNSLPQNSMPLASVRAEDSLSLGELLFVVDYMTVKV